MSFHQLQSSCAFIGPRINAPTPECIAMNVTSPVGTEATAKKERIQVVWDDGSYEGWLIDWSSHPHFISQTTYDLWDFSQFNGSPPTHLIIYDDGDMTPVLLKRGGWLVDIDGDKHRVRRLGFVEAIDSSKNQFRCSKCQSVFPSNISLQAHVRSKWCRARSALDIAQQRSLRKPCVRAAVKFGQLPEKIEPISILTIDGVAVQAVASFRYLGSTVCNNVGASSEIRRRLGLLAQYLPI